MTQAEKIQILEEMLELDQGQLTPETRLSTVAEWDSLAVISFVVLMEERFGKEIGGPQIKGFVTVADALSVMIRQ